MNVLHYCSSLRLELGGVARAVLDLAVRTAERGHRVVIASPEAQDVPAEWPRSAEGGERVPSLVELPAPAARLGRFTGAQMAECLTPLISAADIVHLHTPWDLSNLSLAGRCVRSGTPYVVSAHGMLDDWSMAQRSLKKRVFHFLFARRLLERSAFVHCTAQAEFDQARKWFGSGRGEVAPLLFDLAPFRELPGPGLAEGAYGLAAGGPPIVLFLSRLHYKKGPDVMLDAAGLLRDRGIEALTVFAGTGEPDYERQLRAQAKRLGLGEDRVRFVGMVSGDEKVSLYERAQVFALPTSQENFGFVFPEALACNTPVITTRGVDTWPELEGSGGSVIVERSPEAFADAIAQLLTDADRAVAMGRSGRAWVMKTFDADAIGARYESLYQSAISCVQK
ncbi:MAG: glycosyltransferase [Planctomycetota bacterium]